MSERRAAKPKKKPPPLWWRLLGEAWRGATEPSLPLLVVCLVAFVATIGLGAWMFTPQAMAGAAGDYIPRSGQDGDAFATVDAIRLARRPQTAPTLVVLGTSTIAQGLGNEHILSRRLSARTGQPWKVRVLATPLQSPWDQLKLLETALSGRRADDPPMVVAVGVSPTRMGWTRERLLKFDSEARIGLRSSWVDEEARAAGGHPKPITGNYIADNAHFVLLNGTEALMRFAVRQRTHRLYDYFALGRQPLPPAKRHRDSLIERFRNGGANEPEYLAFYQRLIDRVQARPGVHVVLIEEANSPGLIRAGGMQAEFDRRVAALQDLAARNGTEFWPIFTRAGLEDADFYDDLHVFRGAPQDKVRAQLISDFAAYWSKEKGQP